MSFESINTVGVWAFLKYVRNPYIIIEISISYDIYIAVLFTSFGKIFLMIIHIKSLLDKKLLLIYIGRSMLVQITYREVAVRNTSI